jgi:hypothetical protein
MNGVRALQGSGYMGANIFLANMPGKGNLFHQARRLLAGAA